MKSSSVVSSCIHQDNNFYFKTLGTFSALTKSIWKHMNGGGIKKFFNVRKNKNIFLNLRGFTLYRTVSKNLNSRKKIFMF